MSRATEPLSSRSLIALAVVAAIAHAQAVRAQDAAATPPLEEVTVTGSSIKRGDDAALPVTIVSQEAMELRDASTPVDLLTAMPAVVNVPINDSNQGGVSARGDIASVNLRGLGSGNTLVLLNGRRVAAHGISSTEDGVPAMSGGKRKPSALIEHDAGRHAFFPSQQAQRLVEGGSASAAGACRYRRAVERHCRGPATHVFSRS